MQMRFFSQAGTLQRVYSITRKRLSIEDIQKEVVDLTPHSKWKKIMAEKFNTAFYGDNFSSYSEAFSQLAGLRSDRALYLFSQTVGLKGVGNLNEFIRTHMFEGKNTEAEFEGLVKHYEELSQIYNEIEKAQEQIRLLKEVLEAGKTFELCEKKDLELKEIKNSLQLWYLKTALALIEKKNYRFKPRKTDNRKQDNFNRRRNKKDRLRSRLRKIGNSKKFYFDTPYISGTQNRY